MDETAAHAAAVPQPKMSILIIGAGAIGCMVGAKLALAGHTVVLAGRPRFATAVQTRGLVLHDESGAHRLDSVRAAPGIAAAVNATPRFHLAVFTVKSYDTAVAAQELHDALAASERPMPLLLSLQNGVGNEEQIAALLGEQRLLAGTLTTPVSTPAPAEVRVDKPRYDLGLSPWRPGTLDAEMAQVAGALTEAGFAVATYADARGMKWTKLLMNMLGNAVSAILDAPPETLYSDPDLVDLEIQAWREALAVMQGAGIQPVDIGSYPFSKLAPLIRYAPKALLRPILRKRIGGARGGKMPSLQMDLYSGKGKSEVTWLNGAVVAQGRALGIATPVNKTLTATLLSLVGNEKKMALWRNNPLRLVVAVDEARDQSRQEPKAGSGQRK